MAEDVVVDAEADGVDPVAITATIQDLHLAMVEEEDVAVDAEEEALEEEDQTVTKTAVGEVSVKVPMMDGNSL